MRLRWRLVIAATAAVLIAVGLFGVAASQFVTHELRSASDRSLRDRAGDVARLSASAPALLTSPGTLDAASGGRQLDVEVLDRRGRIVARSLSLGARTLPQTGAVAQALHAGHGGFDDVRIGDSPVRLYAAPLADTGGIAAGGAVIVASRIGDIDNIGDHLRTALLLCGAAAAVLGALAAAFLVGRALAPLRRLSSGVTSIERTGDPAQRLPEPASEDEVHELALALNRMLDALESTSERERRLLADASHELRTPLTSLAGNVDYLAAHGSTPDLVADLQHDTDRLRRLVDALLALEREGATERPTEAVDLTALVAGLRTLDDRVDVDVDGRASGDPADRHAPAGPVGRAAPRAPEPILVAGDPEALRRAAENLVENALVHGPPGGRVWVALRADGQRARIAVTDEGPGIPPAAQAAAFERFWRGPDAQHRPGSGLGLAIVRATATRHGGAVSVDGATVTLDLPHRGTAPREGRSPA